MNLNPINMDYKNVHVLYTQYLALSLCYNASSVITTVGKKNMYGAVIPPFSEFKCHDLAETNCTWVQNATAKKMKKCQILKLGAKMLHSFLACFMHTKFKSFRSITFYYYFFFICLLCSSRLHIFN